MKVKGTIEQLIEALQSLGELKKIREQLRFNCPHCEKELNYAINKFNLEVSYSKEAYKCWACGIHGSLERLIRLYGNKHYLDLFKSSHTTQEEPEDKNKVLCLPSHCISVFVLPPVLEYLLSRGLTKQIIKEREIVFCTKDYYRDCIIFPSYNSKNQLVAFVTHNFITKKYTTRKQHSEFVCFYEKFIDKRIKIILTEGIYDSLTSINSLPLLGTSINKQLLTFLSNTDVLLALDNDVEKIVLDTVIKELKTVCNVEVFKYPKFYKDLNDFSIKNRVELVRTLKNHYI